MNDEAPAGRAGAPPPGAGAPPNDAHMLLVWGILLGIPVLLWLLTVSPGLALVAFVLGSLVVGVLTPLTTAPPRAGRPTR
jgi:hypothetical protein